MNLAFVLFIIINSAFGTEEEDFCNKYKCEGKDFILIQKNPNKFLEIEFFGNSELSGKAPLKINRKGVYFKDKLECKFISYGVWPTYNALDPEDVKGRVFYNQAYDKEITKPKNKNAICYLGPVSFKNGDFKIFVTEFKNGVFKTKKDSLDLYFKLPKDNYEGPKTWERKISHLQACKTFLNNNKDQVVKIFTKLDEVLKTYDRDKTIDKTKLIEAIKGPYRNLRKKEIPSFIDHHSVCGMVEDIGYKNMDFSKCNRLGGLRELSEDEYFGMFIDSALRSLIPRSKDVFGIFNDEGRCVDDPISTPTSIVFKYKGISYIFTSVKGDKYKFAYEFHYHMIL